MVHGLGIGLCLKYCAPLSPLRVHEKQSLYDFLVALKSVQAPLRSYAHHLQCQCFNESADVRVAHGMATDYSFVPASTLLE